jgi:DNA invertase Pin-like site-specific DNA recombinase
VNLLGCFAEFETNLRRERQAEGIAKAKIAGLYKGRPPSIDPTKIRDLKKKGLGASEIAKALKIGRASVYRALEDGPKSDKAKAPANALNRGNRFVWGPDDVEHH